MKNESKLVRFGAFFFFFIPIHFFGENMAIVEQVVKKFKTCMNGGQCLEKLTWENVWPQLTWIKRIAFGRNWVSLEDWRNLPSPPPMIGKIWVSLLNSPPPPVIFSEWSLSIYPTAPDDKWWSPTQNTDLSNCCEIGHWFRQLRKWNHIYPDSP